MVLSLTTVLSVMLIISLTTQAECPDGQWATFARWPGIAADLAPPVFIYTAVEHEDSLVGSCLTRCRELDECAGVTVGYERGSCVGLSASDVTALRSDTDSVYFTKTCLPVPDSCRRRWWAIETAPGYNMHSSSPNATVLLNSTIEDCHSFVLEHKGRYVYRSAQWVGLGGVLDPQQIAVPNFVGNCILNAEDRFTEPESYRVSNYYTFYIENECRHDYPQRIDRCSYEEYHNQTLRRIDFTYKNIAKDECKMACEMEDRFVCRGFTWTLGPGSVGGPGGARGPGGAGDQGGAPSAVKGLCDLHAEDLVTTGSWMLKKSALATYYRRVTCLNISVECEGTSILISYRPRGQFKGRMYIPGRGDTCSARASPGSNEVKLRLPFDGQCDVNFAYAITKTPLGMVNRSMAYVTVMIQSNPVIQTAGDRWVRAGCSPGARSAPAHLDATIAVHDTSWKPSVASDSATPGSSAVFDNARAPLSMYVVRESDAPSDTVALGEPLELRIETYDESELEAYHLVASSRLGDSSVLLLDNQGCPTGQVDFPAFKRTYLNGTQRLASKFKAFRFPNSHVIRFALMTRFCKNKCPPVNCDGNQRTTRNSYLLDEEVPAPAGGDRARAAGVVAQGGPAGCAGGAGGGEATLELEMLVGARDILSADTLIHADHRASDEEGAASAVVCMHELVVVGAVLGWLTVQALLLLGCCVLVKRYRNLAEQNMQKDYHSFDNVGFETMSTHRRVHWPDQNIDIIHAH